MDLIYRLPGKGGFHRLDGRRSGRGGLRFGGGRLRRFMCLLALLLCAFWVHAAKPEIEFDIPRQRADGALNLYAKQANRPLLFRFDIARKFIANPVRGRFTPEAALDRLLADTGLRVVYGPQGSLSIQLEQTTGETAAMNRKHGLLSGLGTILLSTFAVVPGSVAQESGESPALEEIMVTARRVQERMQDTPISITAFTTENLERRQIFSTDLLDQVTPNLQFSSNAVLSGNNAAAAVFIRGVGQVDPTSSVDPGVGMYLDDIYMGQAVGGAMEFRDIENVQVLRGPQGTLFGRNTVGGAILLKTRDPGEEFGGTFRAGYGSDDMRDAFIAVDAPISDTLRTRFSFGTRVRDGYVTRVQTGDDLGDTNTYTATGKFIWDASEQLTVKGMFDYTHSDENGNPFVFATSTETAAFQRAASSDAGCPGFGGVWNSLPAVPMLVDDRCANDFQNKGPYSNNGTYPLKSVLDNWGLSLHLTYAVNDAITLKSITAYRDLSWIGVRDADNTPLAILHTNFESDGWQISQEFQGLYTGEKLRGVVGGYYFDDKHTDLLFVELNTPAPGIQGDSDNNIADNDNWAIFTQWTYDFNEQLSLTAGGRYTDDTKGSIPDQFNYASPSAKYLPVILYEETFTAFTFSGSVSYRWNESIMTYFNYGEGFKGGGWNSHFNVPQTPAMQAQFQMFGPEEATT
ncbi:MAG TPA: TonB-dependent receptor, partial [Gammaproteobacteria bacterium]|nr:TonB-dependent receptor [Gammaproteobacteria bacterium]